jgi:uncharacterized lipoprotein YajG
MSRMRILLASFAVAIAVGIVASSQLGAQPVAQPSADQPPTGFVTVTLSTSSETQTLQKVKVHNLGGRGFLVGEPGERQLTATTPLIWIPVDTIVQMTETTPP